MKCTSTLPGNFKKTLVLLVSFLAITLLGIKSYAQTRTYANQVTIGLAANDHVDNAANALLADNSFARVNSNAGLAAGLGAFQGTLELKFATPVAAGKTSFIRINLPDADLLNSLLGGNLGGLLAKVLGTVVLGNKYFEVGARMGAGTTPILYTSSASGFPNDNIRLIKDANGFFYIAITPNATYDRVYIKSYTDAVLGLGANSYVDVYNAFHTDGVDPCAPAFATSYEGTGLTLDLLGIGKAGVTNMERAIDADPNNFSTMSLGILGVAGSISQDFYFETGSNATDDINIKVAVNPALLNLGLLNNVSVTAYNGTTQVYTQNLSSLLSLDLLGLLNTGQPVSIPISPGSSFDRVKVTLSSLLNVNLAQTISLYGVTRSAGRPVPTAAALTSCSGSTAVLGATTTNANELLWYEAITGGSPVATVAYNATFTTPALTADKTYYVAARRLGCTEESARIPVVITVNPAITFATTTLSNASVASAYSKQINVASGGTGPFTYALASGSTLPAGLTLTSAGLIAGTPTAAGNATFSIVATDSKGCTITVPYTLNVTAALTLPDSSLPNGTTNVLYPVQTIPAATGGTTPFTYAATNLPPGVTFDPATRQITGTPTTAGTYTVPVTATDANGNTVTKNYTLIVRDPLVLPAATLADGTVGVSYPAQIIPPATGGNGPFVYAATGLPPGLTFDPVTRGITGTPITSGNYTVAVTVTDADGKTTTANYALKIADPLVLATKTLADGTVGAAYATETIPAATGGTGPYVYVATNLPAGLTFDPVTRQISGTPTVSGSSNVNVTVTDAAGKTVSQTYVLKVNGTMTLPQATLANGQVGVTYPAQTLPAVTGGTAPYVYVATGLPAGLTFDPVTRQITGTPTTGGSYNVTLKATDNVGASTTTDYSLVVNVPAPVVASVTTCGGTTATLTIANPIAGATYRWYGPTGNTAIATGTSFTTPALTATTTYYAEATSGTAVSTRTPVTITVTPAPAVATINTNNANISSGQTATLQATADAGNTISWYAAASGGVVLGTGTSFTTPVLTATTTYYVETANPSGCVSLSRVPVTVTVTGGPANPNCNAATSQQSGINSVLCLLCGVTDPGASVDADPNTFTHINLAVGVGAVGYQRLIFAAPGAATDSIRLDLATPVGLADLSVLSGATVRVYNGTTLVSTYPLNSNLLNLHLLQGNRFTATLPSGGVFDRVEISFGAVVAALSSLDIYGATIVYPNPTVSSTGLTACYGSPTTLSATANGGTTLKWYASPNSGTVLATGPTFTTGALTATTTFYIEVSKGSCANTDRVPVTVTVNPAITFTATTLNNATVASAYSKQINAATGGTPGFTYTLASGSVLPAGLTLSSTGVIAGIPTVSGNATFSIVAQDSKGCSVTTPFTLNVTPALALPAATMPNGIVGITYPVQTLPAATGGTTPFTYVATNLPPGLIFDPLTRQISGTPTEKGTFVVHLTATDANGNAISTDYTIVVKDPLVLPPATLADGTVGVTYPVQIIPAATGGTSPYTYAATNLPPGLSFNPATREISGTPTQSGTFAVAVTATDADGTTVTGNYSIKVKAALVLPPATLADGNVGISYPPQTIPSATGGTGPYTYTATNLPPGLTFDPVTHVISGTPTQSGLYTVSVTVTDADGTKVTNTYSIRVIGALSLPTMALADGTVGTTYQTQTLPEVSGGTAPYTYTAANLPPGLTFDPVTRQLSGTPTLGGSFTFTITAKDASNNSTNTDYTVQVKVGPPTANPANICAGTSATLTVTNPIAGVTYNWYPATGNTSVFTGITFTTPALSANTTYYVEAVSGTAVSSRTAVAVNVRPAPALAVVAGNATISPGQSTTLQASADAGNTISWYADATGGTALATGPSFTTPALNATTTYYVETANASGCVSNSRVPVTVTVTGGPLNPNCNAATAQQTGITGVCLLCGIEGAGNSTDADPNNFTKINLAVGVAATGYQRLIFQNPGIATDSIRLDLETPVGLADVGVLNSVNITVLNGTTVVSTYSLSSNLLHLQLLNGNRFKVTLAAGGVYDRVEVRFGGLASLLSNLSIYGAEVIYPNPTVAASGQTICAGNTTTLSATANGGTTLRWFAAASGGTALATGATFTTPVLTSTTTYYIEVSKGTCANVQRVPVTVTVTPAPAAPALAAVPPVCYGTAAVLNVNNPVAGLTYNWYTAATGGTPVFSGASFTTPALTANTTYYVESVSGGCGSSTRTAVPVTVNPALAAPQLQASATTVNAGQTVILTATSTDTDVTFNWYNTAGGTTPVYSGPTYVTPPLTATTTYYLEAKSNTTGCVTPTRVQVTINVNGGGSPNPVPCLAATTQTNGVDGVVLFGGVFNPGLAVDNDTKTGSSLVIPVGLLTGSVYQRAGFGSLSSIGDTIKVSLSAPGKLLSLGVLSSIQVGTYNGATSNNDAVAINNNAVRVELLSGNSEAIVSFVPTAVFDQVEVRLGSGLAGVLSTVDFNYAQRILVAPTVVSANVTACATQTAVLQVSNPNAGITYKWYDATGANLLGQGASFTTPVLSASTKFYVEATTASGCASYRTVVNVTVTPAPVAPQLLSSNIQTCTGSSVVLTVGNPQQGLTYIWKSGNTVLQSGPQSTYTIAAVTGPATYTVSAQNSCGAVSAETTATVDVGTPTPPVITPSAVTINKNERAVLTATSTVAGATFTWYDRDPALPGAQVVSSPTNGENGTFLTPVLTTTTTYWVTSTAGLCTSAGASVVVTVLPDATPVDVPCEAAVAEENGVGGLASALAGVDNPALVFDNNINTGSSLRIPVGIGSFVYQRAIFTGLSTLGDKVRVKLVSPNGLLSLALVPSIEVTSYNGTTSNNDTKSINDPLVQLQILPGNQEAIVEFTPTSPFDRVEVRLNSGLIGALTSVNFNYAQRIQVPPVVLATAAQACAGSQASLSVKNPVTDGSVTYKWYLGSATTASGSGATYLTDATLAAGTYDFFVTATRNGCESAKTKVTVTILPVPDAPVAVTGNPTKTCPNVSVTLAVNQVAGVAYTWYDAAVGGNVLAANTSTYVTPANLTPGVYNYYVEAANGNTCVSTAARTQITLTVNPSATLADLSVTGANAPLCINSKATLTASSTTVTNPVFTWYSDAALTTAVFTGPVYEPVITTNTTFYVTVSGDNKCANTAGNALAVNLILNPPATAADLQVTGDDAPFCAGTKASLTASTTTVVNPKFTWYSDAALTTAVFTGPVYEPVVTATTTYYVTVSGDNRCENLTGNAEVVTLTVNTPALPSDLTVTGAETGFCSGTKARLVASSTTVTNPVFTWYSDANLTTPVFTGAVYEPVVTASTTYYVTVSGTNRCPSPAANAKVVNVNVNPNGTAADIAVAGADAPVCNGNNATLTASSTTVTNPVFTWYSDAALTNALYTGPVFTTSILNATTTYYVTVRGDNKCESSAATAKAVTITVNPPAVSTDITIAGADATFCGGTTAILTASSTTVSSPIFTWYSDATLTTPVFTGPVYSPVVTATTTYYVTVRGTNRCENARGDAKIVTLVVNPPATAADVIVSGAENPFCAGTSVSLTASSTTVTNPVFTWYTDAQLTNAIFTGPVLNRVVNATTTYYVTVKGANKCENAPGTGKAVTITINPLPDVPIVANGNGTAVCAGDGTVLSVQNVQTGVTYEWYDAPTGGTLLFSSSDYNTGALSATTDFYVLAKSNSGCGSATGRVKVTVTVSPKPANPSVVSTAVNACSGSTVVLSVSNPQTGITYNWYADATGTNILGSGVNFTTPVITANTTFYVAAVSGTCSSPGRTAVNITLQALPAAPTSIAGATNPLCAGSTTVLSVNNPDPSLTYRWYSTQNGGTALAEGTSFSTPALAATTTYYVAAVNTLTGCSSVERTAVVVTVLQKLTSPLVTAQSVTASSITFAWPAVAGATAYEVSLDAGLTWISPNSGPTGTSHLVSNLKPGQSVSIRVRARGQLDCQVSDASSLTAKSDNPLGNQIFVPNTFTPNNDGKNDVLYVFGNTIAKMRLRVYNQWGQFIYESLNISNGWDGTYKGEIQPNGVYVYLLEAEFSDGTKTTKKGTVTLLR